MRRLFPVVLAVATASASACADPATGTGARTDPTPHAGRAAHELHELVVAPRTTLRGYSRDHYPHWAEQGNRCDTRETVLTRDGKKVQRGDDCYPTSGTWTSPYDGQTWTRASDVDIDHTVSLANSWVSGASAWTPQQREAFANDLRTPQLVAVTDDVNRTKSDQSPDQWRPPQKSYWCRYSSDWITVKHHYGLTITEAEKAALVHMQRHCRP